MFFDMTDAVGGERAVLEPCYNYRATGDWIVFPWSARPQAQVTA